MAKSQINSKYPGGFGSKRKQAKSQSAAVADSHRDPHTIVEQHPPLDQQEAAEPQPVHPYEPVQKPGRPGPVTVIPAFAPFIQLQPNQWFITWPGNEKRNWDPKPPSSAVFKIFRVALKAAGYEHTQVHFLLMLPPAELTDTNTLKDRLIEAMKLRDIPKDFGGLIKLDLTTVLKVRQVRRMREKADRRTANPFDGLASLATPSQPSNELLKLAGILDHAKTNDPPDRKQFVQFVNAALEKHALAIRIEETGKICRKLRLDRNGTIELQPTAGGSNGFKDIRFTVVPYTRPYQRKG